MQQAAAFGRHGAVGGVLVGGARHPLVVSCLLVSLSIHQCTLARFNVLSSRQTSIDQGAFVGGGLVAVGGALVGAGVDVGGTGVGGAGRGVLVGTTGVLVGCCGGLVGVAFGVGVF